MSALKWGVFRKRDGWLVSIGGEHGWLLRHAFDARQLVDDFLNHYEATIARLEAEVLATEARHDARVDDLIATREQVRVLTDYAQHRLSCPRDRLDIGAICECGLDAALAAVEEEMR